MTPNYPGKTVDVAIVGAGPVGLTASLLLSRFRVHHLVIEKQLEPTEHPQAHFISCRSMEIFRELNGLEKEIRRLSAPLDEWRCYIYCTSVADLPDASDSDIPRCTSLLGTVDHFADGPDHHISPTWESNLPQHDLERLLRKAAAQSPFCQLIEGRRAAVTELDHGVELTLTEVRTGQNDVISSRYAVCADGAHSETRRQLGISRDKKTDVLQHLINVHFTSPELSGIIRRTISGMLYFVYAPQAIGVIVNHSLERGEFVLQLPYFPPHQDAADFSEDKCRAIIRHLAGCSIAVDIKSISPWRLSAWNAKRYRSSNGRCFLVGDAAHQMLPAGGFGLNSGIADVHNLTWKLALALRLEKENRPEMIAPLLTSYEEERRITAERFIATSIDNYQITTAVPAAIGLEPRAVKLLDIGVRWTPLPRFLRRKLFDTVFRIGLAQVKLLNKDNIVGNVRRMDLEKLFTDPRKTLAMRFPQLDLGSAYAKGYLERSTAIENESGDSSRFRPKLILGGRLPHFWLQKYGGKSTEKISSLDLVATAAGQDGRPVYIFLVCGMAQQKMIDLANQLQEKFSPLKKIYISANVPLADEKTGFAFAGDRPSFLSPRFAVLIRPDAHVAWLETG